MPTTGRLRGRPPAEPKKPALPKVKMPPSDATSQYDEFAGAAGDGEGGPGRPAEPENAYTWSVLGDRRSPSPTEGVGKWLAWPPTETCCISVPVAGLRPNSVDPPIDQTSPPAVIGGP